MALARFQKTTGIGYAAYSSERLTPIVIAITSTSSRCSYNISGPMNLAHGSSWRFDVGGDCSLCEAAIKALKSLTPGRTWRLRQEMAAIRAPAATQDEIPRDAPAPKLAITIKTSSPSFAQKGECLSATLRTSGNSPCLAPSLRAFRKQLQRFHVIWILLPVESSAIETPLEEEATEATRVALDNVHDSERSFNKITPQRAPEHECGFIGDIRAAAEDFSFERLLSANDAAELLRIHVNTLRLWARQGKVPSRYIGRRLTFRASTLNRWLEDSCYAGSAVLTASTERTAA
jgi:excisionase family DNA binding protein